MMGIKGIVSFTKLVRMQKPEHNPIMHSKRGNTGITSPEGAVGLRPGSFQTYFAILIFLTFLGGCGVYTFNGSTLPGYLKTVDIPLFENVSLKPEVAEDITTALNRGVLSANLLRIVSQNGDATIHGIVKSYDNHPYTYTSPEYRTVSVSAYAVAITVDVTFTDNRKGKDLYKGVLSGQGIYDNTTDTEEKGRKLAVEDIVKQIMQNSVQSW
jgi:hypothetical protein